MGFLRSLFSIGQPIVTSGSSEDEDTALLQAEPISRKRMDLLWLDPPRLAQLGRSLEKDKMVTVTMGDSSNLRDHELTQEDFEWAKQIEQIVDKAYSTGQRGNYRESIQHYKEALELAPGCDLFLMSIGVGYSLLGQKAKGILYLERAAQISPGNSRIRENLQKAKHRSASGHNFGIRGWLLVILILIFSVLLSFLTFYIRLAFGTKAFLASFVIFLFVPAVLNIYLARKRSRNWFGWMLIGIFGSYPWTMLLLYLGPRIRSSARRVPLKIDEPCTSPGSNEPPKSTELSTPLKAERADSVWTPTNARFASHIPLSDLQRIFIFTNGNGQTVLDSPVATGTLQDTAEAPLQDFMGKVKLDVIARSNVANQIQQMGQFPESAWDAMSKIDSAITQKARAGTYRSVVRVFADPRTREQGVLVLIYRM